MSHIYLNLYMQHDKAPFVIRTVEGRGINRPKDIEGRKFGTPAGNATSASWR
jgi:ABC-type nitrate/sulfonate/bicarbonate transport system substrate-binding protein